MRDLSKMSYRMICETSAKCICSQVLALGLTLSETPDGVTICQCGQARLPASPSLPPDSARESKTIATSSQPCSTSLTSAALTRSLWNKYRRATEELGSTMYALVWKEVDTPQGRSLPVQQGSAHRTCGNDYISPQQQVEALYPLPTVVKMAWATPQAHDAIGARSEASAQKKSSRCLAREVKFCGTQATPWATPAARDWKDGRASQETMDRGSRPLNEQAVQLTAGWMTPSCTNMVRSQEGIEKRIAYRNSIGRHFVEGNLEEQVVVQLTGFGQMPSGFPAEMESSDPPSQESTPSPPVS